MKPINQTKLHDPESGINGNCLAASFASILELPLSDIPKFEDMGKEKWFQKFKDWLEDIGFTLLEWREETWLPGYYLVSGKSERGFNHTVIYKDGKLIHDPHPSRAGIKKIDEIWALLPTDPAQCNKLLHMTPKNRRK